MGTRYGPDTVLLRTTPSGRLYHFRNGGRDAWGTCLESRSLDMEGQGWELCLTPELRYEWLRSVLLLEQNMLRGHVLCNVLFNFHIFVNLSGYFL